MVMVNMLIIKLLFTFIFISLNTYASAMVNDLFFIQNLKASSDFGNTEEAKKMSFNIATREAMNILLNRIANHKQESKFHDLVKLDNTNLVEKYITREERRTSKTYKAQLDIRFNEEKVKTLLNQRGINFSNKIYNNCLIVPFYEDSIKNLATRWIALTPEQLGIVKPIVIRNNLDDVLFFSPKEVMKQEYNHFKELLNKYTANDIALVKYEILNKKIYVTTKFMTPEGNYLKELIFNNEIDNNKNTYNPYDISPDTHKKIINSVLLNLDSWQKGDKNAFTQIVDTPSEESQNQPQLIYSRSN
jgi:hypothetical protein